MNTSYFQHHNDFLANVSWSKSGMEHNHSISNESECEEFYCNNTHPCFDRSLCLQFVLEYIYPSVYEWIIISLYAIIFVVGLIGNFLVCFAVYRNPSMHTVTNYFIVNLAVADFLVIIICMPPTVLEDVAHTWYIGGVLCKIIKYLQVVSVSVSVFTLSCISVERWYAICHPLKFKSTPRRAKQMILVIWLVAVLLMIPELVTMNTTPFAQLPPDIVWMTTCKPTWSKEMTVGFQSFIMVALYLLPLLLMFFTYQQIARRLWSTSIPTETSRDQLHPNNCASGAETQLLARRKAAKMLIAVVVMFALCYLPVYLLNILGYAGVLNNMQDELLTIMALLSHWLGYFNSAVNPVIYNFMSAKFRKEFKQVFTCGTCKREDRLPRRPVDTYSYKYTHSMNCRTSHLTAAPEGAVARMATMRV